MGSLSKLTRRHLVIEDPVHAFDILGVSTKEDSYINLVAAGIRRPWFRTRLLALLGCEDAEDWEAFVRRRVVVALGKARGVPDLTLMSRSHKRVVIVEAKIYASEGRDQISAYLDDGFQERLLRIIGAPEGTAVDLAFLTLEQHEADAVAQRRPVRPASLETLTRTPLVHVDASDPVDHLLAELWERMEERASWPSPQPDEIVSRYFTRPARFGLIDEGLRFRRFVDQVGDLGMTTYDGVVSNSGIGPSAFRQWWHPDWVVGGDGVMPNRLIHLELHSTSLSPDGWTLDMHYEMNPYMPESKAMGYYPSEFIDEYRAARRRFRRDLDLPSPWKPTKWSWNAMAKTTLDVEATTAAFTASLGQSIRAAATAISSALPPPTPPYSIYSES